MNPSVYLLILTWNSKKHILECLESVQRLDYDNLHVVVIDNGSSDGTAEAVRDGYGDKMTLIENGENLMFARGNNVGIKYALEQKADYIMLMNDDVAVDSRMISELVGAAESATDIGVVGPKIYYWEPKDQIWFAGGKIYLHRGTGAHIGIRETDRGQYDEQREVDYITGCALMMKRAVIEEIGLLDPAYYFYWEDADWCMRARKAGSRVVYVPTAKLWHKISASAGGQLSKRKIKAKLRSGAFFFRRYAKWYHWLTIPVFQIFDALRVLLLVLLGKFRDTTAAK
ncbi:glycosyltransferase family 2 protein [bacterium]|nr:glycosyltransferase family 2 protein [bacterium]